MHYIFGFKAVSLDPKTLKKTEPTRRLDEAVTQYLAMCMNKDFEGTNPVIALARKTGLIIDRESILTAEILERFFKRCGITPHEVEVFHRDSDLKGFLEYIRDKAGNIAKGIIVAGGIAGKDKSVKIFEP